jgi:hypothetical protein
MGARYTMLAAQLHWRFSMQHVIAGKIVAADRVVSAGRHKMDFWTIIFG